MVKAALAIAIGFVGAALANPVAEDLTQDEEKEVHQFRQLGLATVLGSIGTALVPVFGAVFGPILTNLATGISTAFNNGLNPAPAPTKTESIQVDGQTLLVRIPSEALLNFLAQPTQEVEEGLPSVGPNKQHFVPGKSGAEYVNLENEASASSQEDIYDSVVVEATGDLGGASSFIEPQPIKRRPQKQRPDTQPAKL